MLLLLDWDTACYRAAGAAQRKNKETGELELDPSWAAIGNAKRLVKDILEVGGTDNYKMFLTETNDDTDFRKLLYPEYKANRDRSTRPHYYELVREYYISSWKAEVVKGIEADDAVVTAQYTAYNNTFDNKDFYNPYVGEPPQAASVIIGIDKDLQQCPGWHLHMGTKVWSYITPLQGLKSFYKQILAGDRADNVPRIKKGWREKEAFEKIDKVCTEIDIYDIVLEEYRKIYKEEAENELKWRGEILWLRRHLNDQYKSPTNSYST